MNQREFVNLVSKRTGEPKANVLLVLDTFINTMLEALLEGDKVSITKLGTFKIKKRKGRQGYDPYRAKIIDIPSSMTVGFSVNKHLKEKLLEEE